ncbi:unnamed protein product [Camellia sinensis]
MRERERERAEIWKMSWQTYVDDHLMCDIEGNHLTSTAILGHDGSFKPDEITGIMKDLDEPGFLAPIGLYLGDTKYMVIQGEPGAVIRGKKNFLFAWLVLDSCIGMRLVVHLAGIKDEVRSVLEFINYTYEIFGFTYDLKLSTLQQMSDDPMNQVSHCGGGQMIVLGKASDNRVEREFCGKELFYLSQYKL